MTATAVGFGGLIAVAGPAAAKGPCGNPGDVEEDPNGGAAITCVYDDFTEPGHFDAPEGVTDVTATLTGGSGGASGAPPNSIGIPGAQGGTTTVTIKMPVNGIEIWPGGAGSAGQGCGVDAVPGAGGLAGGQPSGGTGGAGGTGCAGGGGGGGSFVTAGNSAPADGAPLASAGGGGGSGAGATAFGGHGGPGDLPAREQSVTGTGTRVGNGAPATGTVGGNGAAGTDGQAAGGGGGGGYPAGNGGGAASGGAGGSIPIAVHKAPADRQDARSNPHDQSGTTSRPAAGAKPGKAGKASKRSTGSRRGAHSRRAATAPRAPHRQHAPSAVGPFSATIAAPLAAPDTAPHDGIVRITFTPASAPAGFPQSSSTADALVQSQLSRDPAEVA